MTAPLENLESRARGIGISPGLWPYGATDDRPQVRLDLLHWAEAHQLRYAGQGQNLDWITSGRCPGHTRCQVCAGKGPEVAYGWMDHVTGWTRDNEPAVLIAQPYRLPEKTRAQLELLATTHGLDLHVGDTGWYGADTVFIELWRQARGV